MSALRDPGFMDASPTSSPIQFPSLPLALKSNNKLRLDLEAGAGPQKFSRYRTFRFQMGCLRDQRTLWWHRILTGALLIGSLTCYQIIPRAVNLEQALHVAFCCWEGASEGRQVLPGQCWVAALRWLSVCWIQS